ncbi:MAG TPA: hypothetical protein VGG32_07035 [Thermoplasmata archaeon]|jgi:hypothetical protein
MPFYPVGRKAKGELPMYAVLRSYNEGTAIERYFDTERAAKDWAESHLLPTDEMLLVVKLLGYARPVTAPRRE